MKALSIQQPWAWAIMHLGKDIENRTWSSSYRGELLIHAAKTFDSAGYDWIMHNLHSLTIPGYGPGSIIEIPTPKGFERGGIVGVVNMVDCVTGSDSPWFFGKYGFVLVDPRPVPFMAVRGQLGIFDVALRRKHVDRISGIMISMEV